MKDLRKEVDEIRRKLDDLVIKACTKRKICLDGFNFKEAEQLEKSVLGLQKANSELFYVNIALM